MCILWCIKDIIYLKKNSWIGKLQDGHQIWRLWRWYDGLSAKIMNPTCKYLHDVGIRWTLDPSSSGQDENVVLLRNTDLIYTFRKTRAIWLSSKPGKSIHTTILLAQFRHPLVFCKSSVLSGGRDSSAGIATRYGLDGPGDRIPVGGEIFHTRPDRPWGPPSLLYNGVPGLSRG